MAQVPYNPVPQEKLQMVEEPNRRVNTPDEAFGGSIGTALRQLGTTAERAGDEIFSRAIALKQLENDALKTDAEARYIEETGDAVADYNSTQGRNAVDGFRPFREQVAKTRDMIRDTLPNDQAKKLYDAATRGFMARTIFSAAGHSARENKNWQSGAANSAVKSYQKQALINPDDSVGFEQWDSAVEANVRQRGNIEGWGPEQTDYEVSVARSNMWKNRITGMAKGRPFEAQKVLDEAMKGGKLQGEDVAAAQNAVTQQVRTVGAREVSNNVRSGASLAPGSTIVPLPQARNAVTSFEAGGNYAARGPEVFDKKTGRSRGRALGAFQIMPENLQPWLRESGLPPMSEAEFLRDKGAQDKVFDTIFGGYMQKYGSFNEAVSRWFTGRSIAEAGPAAGDGYSNLSKYLRATNKTLAQGAPLSQQVEWGKQEAARLVPLDPLFEDFTVGRITADHNVAQRVKIDDERNARYTVEQTLIDGATNVDEIKAAGPEAEAAWDNLPPPTQRRYLQQMASASKKDIPWNNDSLKRRQQLMGLADSDPAAFLDMEITGENLPMAGKKELLDLQRKKKNKAESDPRVARAMQILRPILGPADLIQRKAANKDDYDQFVGVLQDQLSDFAADHKRSPTPEEVTKIGSQLLREISTPKWYFLGMGGTTPQWQVPIPPELATKIKSDPRWAENGIEPTDQMIQRVYVREQMTKLYGKKPSADKPQPQGGGPQVPRSE